MNLLWLFMKNIIVINHKYKKNMFKTYYFCKECVNMSKCTLSLLAGLIIGMSIAYNYEDELDDTVHQMCRCKRKMMRKVQQLSK